MNEEWKEIQVTSWKNWEEICLEYLDVRGWKLQEGRENGIMSSGIVCTSHQKLLV